MTAALPRVALLAAALGLAACARGVPPPAPLDTRTESCAFCRMAVSERRFSSQIVAPGEEPLFFDDLGCLQSYLGEKGTPFPAAVVYVADHRTGDWIAGPDAVFGRSPAVETPMSSHLLAYASEDSLRLDPAAQGVVRVDASEVLGPMAAKGRDR